VELNSSDFAHPQETIGHIAQVIGVSVDDILSAVRKLGIPYEPSQRDLTTNSFLFTKDIVAIREQLGLLSRDETELRGLQKAQAKREMRNMRILVFSLVSLGAIFLVLSWRPFFGWLAGSYDYRGGTFPDLVSTLINGFRWLITRPSILVSLAILVPAFLILDVWWKKRFNARETKS
jgi:hypothetical protein